MSIERQQVRLPWLGVEVRHLAALQAIERRGSFSGAAAELGYVQSAISQQIARLERAVGTRLIERQRGQRAVTLTPAGALLAVHARELLREFQAARLDLAAIQEGSSESLEAGLTPGIAESLMVGLAARRMRGPALKVRFSEADSPDELVGMIEQGLLDVGLGCAPADASAFESRPVVEDRYVALLPAASPLARQPGPVDPQRLCGFKLVTPPATADAEPIEGELRDRGLDLAGAQRCATAAACQVFVATGQGVAILPELSLSGRIAGTVAMELDGPPLHRTLAVFWQKHRQATERLESFARVAATSIRAGRPCRLAIAA